MDTKEDTKDTTDDLDADGRVSRPAKLRDFFMPEVVSHDRLTWGYICSS